MESSAAITPWCPRVSPADLQTLAMEYPLCAHPHGVPGTRGPESGLRCRPRRGATGPLHQSLWDTDRGVLSALF